jgi:ATP-binding cassette, subfamily F, member 3
MLLSVTIQEKYAGTKLLLKGASFTLQPGMKTALIGRNGTGKSTLLGIISGEDTDYVGSIETRKNLRIITTAQEHHHVDTTTPVHYVLDHVPGYFTLNHILETYPERMGDDVAMIRAYSDALETFSNQHYFSIEDEIVQMLAKFGIDAEAAYRPMGSLSGGQKRLVELVKVSFSQADAILLDEPTNHLDYHGKQQFLTWHEGITIATLIVSHDRDLLRQVDYILELRDHDLHLHKGNYDAYIKQNSTATITKISHYESSLKRLDALRVQMNTAKARMYSASDSRPKILYERLKREHDELKDSLEKPSFWIDKDTVDSMSKKVTGSYDRYKTRGIAITATSGDTHEFTLLELRDVSIGYNHTLLSNITFSLQHGERLQLRGRNGAGKSTLIQAIRESAQGASPKTLQHGKILSNPKLRIGHYDQEVQPEMLNRTLEEAITHHYNEAGVALGNQQLKSLLAGYQFNPVTDGSLIVRQLSGGQKARLQIIAMLACKPNLLILDEPSNHLDLPSIEDLETALQDYTGGILYVTHDTYFATSLGGQVLQLGPT